MAIRVVNNVQLNAEVLKQHGYTGIFHEGGKLAVYSGQIDFF